MMTNGAKLFEDMNTRSREVFRRVVEGYLENGEPVGSRTLTRTLTEKVSAATVRNVMQDLEYLGLLDSPHISAGRIPTQMGLRMFVDGLLEIGEMNVAWEATGMWLSLERNVLGGLVSSVITERSIHDIC